MPLFEFQSEGMKEVPATTFSAANLKERDHLQRALRNQIDVLMPDSMVLAEEFSNWEDSKRRIDLLVLDRDANLIVVELKRTEDGGHMELQAIRYAAMVSAMTFQQAVEAHGQYLMKLGTKDDPQARILEFLNWDEPQEDEFAQDVKIVLASADFSKEVTTAVLWLNECGLDIRCVRMLPYQFNGTTLLDVQQVIPLVEATEFQVSMREKASRERDARRRKGGSADRNLRFWSTLLAKANRVIPLHQNVSPSTGNWIAASAHGTYYTYAFAHGVCRVELYLTKPDAAENKAIFDDLLKHKSEIEKAFGGPLDWQRMNDRAACRIAAEINAGVVHDESTWDRLQTAMVEGMKRLEAALRPYAQKYREGASPIGS